MASLISILSEYWQCSAQPASFLPYSFLPVLFWFHLTSVFMHFNNWENQTTGTTPFETAQKNCHQMHKQQIKRMEWDETEWIKNPITRRKSYDKSILRLQCYHQPNLIVQHTKYVFRQWLINAITPIPKSLKNVCLFEKRRNRLSTQIFVLFSCWCLCILLLTGHK